MVIIHIANIDTAVIGGVQFAVPEMVKAQSRYADVRLLNTYGDIVDNVPMLHYDSKFDINKLSPPFNKPDIVIFHEIYRFEYIKIYRHLVKCNIPYIIVPHGCLSKKAQQKKKFKKTIANTMFFNNFINHAQSIQYLSNNEKDMSVFKKHLCFVTGNGVSIPNEKKCSFSKTKIKFVYIGRLEMHIKGLDLLLNAIKKCENLLRESCAIFEIYGPNYDNSHQSLIQMINKLDIADLVYINKEKTGEEKKEILCSATCFIQTSRTEALPLGPLEALSYGLPCVVSEGVGLGNIIEDYGAGYQSENTVDGISNSIEQFIKNIDEIEIMSNAAICLIGENFDINLIAKKAVDIYSDIVN